ncbi:MAG TPA: hypothetical protein VEF36_09100 [Roseiarcus sp.]|jgi:hypothetical protein|nr:hypothetical protein [Roseiarcus sp.]
MRDAVVSGSSTATRKTIVAVLATLGLGMLVASAGLVVAPKHAAALPAYAAKEGKPCGYCHVNPAGGGARTDKGKAYEANGHKF